MTASSDVHDDDTSEKATAPKAGLSSPMVAIAALVVAFAALALSGWNVVREPGSAAPEKHYSGEERTKATNALCSAFDVVRAGIMVNTNMRVPEGSDQALGSAAMAANARVALTAGSQYLSSHLDPAVPEQLTNESRKLATLLADIGATAIKGVSTSDPQLAEQMQDAEKLTTSIHAQCKDV